MKYNMRGDANHIGPVMLSDVYTSAVGSAKDGVAASQRALYDAYNSLNSSVKGLQNTAYTTLANLFRIQSTTISCNNAANSEKKSTPTAVSGYTALGIVGWDANGNSGAILKAWRLRYNSSTNQIIVAWDAAIATTASLIVYMLYVKT